MRCHIEMQRCDSRISILMCYYINVISKSFVHDAISPVPVLRISVLINCFCESLC